MIRNLLLTFMVSCVTLLEAAAPFRFAVYRAKLTRNEPGQLEISEAALNYRSDNGKTTLSLPLSDIREADVSKPDRITIETYDVVKRRLGGHQAITFRLRDGTHGEDLARFLAHRLKRPLIGSYALAESGAFEIPAYHHELLGGSHGLLGIGSEGIRFVSKNPKDSRTWLYRDIETIGSADPFHFRVTSYVETFTLDLKERLPEDAYRLAWKQVYGQEKR